MESSAPASVSSLPPAQAPARRSPRRAFTLLAIVLGVVVAGLGVYLFLTRNQESTDDAEIEADVVPIAPRVGGTILKVEVKDNQHVKAGELLVEIDPADYDAKEKQAEAELSLAQARAEGTQAQEKIVEASATGGFSSAEAALSGSSVGVFSADSQVEASQAALLRSQADQHKAELDLRRTKQLFADHAVAQDRMDNAQIAFESSSAQLAQARAQISSASEARHAAKARVAEAKGRLGMARPIEAQIQAARAQALAAGAQVKAAEAMLALAKLQLSYTRVIAPSDGIASKVRIQPGQLLSPGQPIVELVPEAVYLEANFKETQIGSMKPGQRVDISVDAFPGRTFHGTVESLSGGTGARFSLLPPDNASGNFVKVVQRVPVRIRFTEPPRESLQAGLSADVTVYEE